MTAFRADASIPLNRQTVSLKSRANPVKKLGSGSRATFVSPYLRRPLRPLDKVLSEREDRDDESLSTLSANDSGDTLVPVSLGPRRKSAASPD